MCSFYYGVMSEVNAQRAGFFGGFLNVGLDPPYRNCVEMNKHGLYRPDALLTSQQYESIVTRDK